MVNRATMRFEQAAICRQCQKYQKIPWEGSRNLFPAGLAVSVFLLRNFVIIWEWESGSFNPVFVRKIVRVTRLPSVGSVLVKPWNLQ
jgi:hypothetical protein